MPVPALVQENIEASGYYKDLLAGNVFVSSNAQAGVALTASAATTQNIGWINPTGSGKNMIPIAFITAPISTAGTWTGDFCLNYQAGVNYPAATGAAITTFTATDSLIFNCLLGGGNKSVVHFASAAASIVLAAAPTFVMNLGILGGVVAPAANPVGGLQHWFHATVAVTPGTIFIPCNTGVDAGLWSQTLIWVERPVTDSY